MEKELYLTKLSEILEKQRNESQTQFAQLLVEMNSVVAKNEELKAELDKLKTELAALKTNSATVQPRVTL